VPSAAIAQIKYDDETHELLVTFTTGRKYIYFDVPKSEYVRFRSATSKGAYFNKCIRDRYDYAEIKGMPG
jgi:hypothetical protein